MPIKLTISLFRLKVTSDWPPAQVDDHYSPEKKSKANTCPKEENPSAETRQGPIHFRAKQWNNGLRRPSISVASCARPRSKYLSQGIFRDPVWYFSQSNRTLVQRCSTLSTAVCFWVRSNNASRPHHVTLEQLDTDNPGKMFPRTVATQHWPAFHSFLNDLYFLILFFIIF